MAKGTDHHNCGSTVVVYLAKVYFGQLRLNVGEVAEEFAVDGNLEQVFCGHHREVENLTQIEGKSAVIFWRESWGILKMQRIPRSVLPEFRCALRSVVDRFM